MTMKTALLILDMLNTFDFPDGKILARRALPVAQNILRLKARCKKAGVPIIYVNDNFGMWHADWVSIYQACVADRSDGKQIARLMKPDEGDHFVLKPKHSGFYCTNLEPLLHDLHVKRLILCGIAGDICVLFTAHDAHMRNFDLIIPKDGVVSLTGKGDRFLIHQFEKTLKFPMTRSIRIHL